MKTILGLWAHPDDEVFVSGGFMAEAARRGDRVVCVHMTRGEAGLYYRSRSEPQTLGRIRQSELEASLAHLGVAEQRFLDYSDGCLSQVPRVEAVGRIHETLADVRPDVIVTFGADGFTGHPDHKALSSWVTSAVRLWNRPRARLYHAVVPKHWNECFVPRLNEFNFFWPDHPIYVGHSDVTVTLDDELLEAKVRAIREHASQMLPLFDSYGEEFMRAVAATEHFQRGPRPAFTSRVRHDLQSR